MLEQSVQNCFWNAGQSMQIAAMEWQRPFVLLKPRVFPDGNAWCALYGEDLQQGVAGFGNTPAAAAADFDLQWSTQKALPTHGVPEAPAPDPFTVSAALSRLIADDAYAMTFQTMGQYRTALLRVIDNATAASGVPAVRRYHDDEIPGDANDAPHGVLASDGSQP